MQLCKTSKYANFNHKGILLEGLGFLIHVHIELFEIMIYLAKVFDIHNGIGHVWLCDNNCPPPPPPSLLHTYDKSGGSGRFSDTPSVTLSGWRRTSDPLGT